MSQEDIEWFKSTFRPIPKPELPDDCVEYSLHYISSNPAPALVDEATDIRARLTEVQKSAAELTKQLLKDYIWQREAFRLEATKKDGTHLMRLSSQVMSNEIILRNNNPEWANELWGLS
jgi:hypothetical protein